ncbi:MAG: hypothetical protein ACLTDR_09070 [Adlercreutzia equolifaciens]
MGSRAMKGRKGTKVKNKKVIVLSVLGVFVAFIAAGVFGVVTLCNSWLEDLPDYQNADAYNSAQPTMGLRIGRHDAARRVPAGESRPGGSRPD